MEHHTRILDRIQKVIAQARGAEAIGNDKEALAFHEKAQQLLAQYDIDTEALPAADVAIDLGPVSVESIDWRVAGLPVYKKRCQWTQFLAQVFCEAHNCQLLVQRGSNAAHIVGHAHNRELVIYLVTTLTRYGNQSWEDYRKTHRSRIGKQSYLMGYAVAIYYQVKALKEEQEEPVERGLVRLSQEREQVDAYMQDLGVKMNKSDLGGKIDAEAFRTGRGVGEHVDVRGKAINHQAGKAQPALVTGLSTNDSE